MTLMELLIKSSSFLESKGIDESYLQAELILMKASQADRSFLYANPDLIVDKITQDSVEYDCKLRVLGKPWAYICGYKEFFGLKIALKEGVFIPRPETELLVEIALCIASEFPSDQTIRIGEPCTGSGAISVAIAKSLNNAHFYCTDSSRNATNMALLNAKTYNVLDRFSIYQCDLLEKVNAKCDIIVSNPPYIPKSYIPTLQKEVLAEPLKALDGGPDGLEIIRKLLMQIQTKSKIKKPGCIILEILPENSDKMIKLARSYFPDSSFSVFEDLSKKPRVLLGRIA